MTLERSIDFDRVAELYDAYVTVSFDHEFWLDVARRVSGARLELMCGTGRISLAILSAGLGVDGLDYSEGLLSVFARKLAQQRLHTSLHRADARDFSIAKTYELIFIGFHSIAEVIDDADKLRVFECVRRHLDDAGELWVSLHNPAIRREMLDGEERSVGVFSLPDSRGELEVTGQYHLDPALAVVTGVQRYFIRAAGEGESSIELPVRFHLISPDSLDALLSHAGFRVAEQRGSYDGAPYDPVASPYYLIGCRRAGR